MSGVDVACADSLKPGQCRTVEVRGKCLAIANVDGKIFALDNRCPHRGAPLGAGYLSGDRLFCPMHGWEFDVGTGAGVTRPDLPVKSYPARVEAGRIWVDLEAIS